MPSKDNTSSGSSGSSYHPYQITNTGTNTQGNSWDTRTQPGGSAYHYSNTDGSYYYSNANGSTYHNNGSGGSTYKSPSGNVYKK
ncbi:uncharacterized protein A1O5_04972 [Cladophialophora psammophila CBS 110553]|uniref:Uncharacterized protein n=1 Tax=Cladophialophora psammophila CBS 110553 TaxID=1182543 RepID=W9WX12_9EURO|nr:uncharacterized protein A1O5_04972 [Cladophialophora psammophila CBS 110553]EXJ72468.1 hypothetical protein A1O5_04972 [Cladophialophora psammophila CBS 110553]